MKFLKLGIAALAAISLAACAVPGATTDLSGAAASTLSVARSGVDAAANAFDGALYGLDFAMDAKLLVPGSAQAKQIAAVGRQVQHYLNVADGALKAGNSAEAKAALDQANALVTQFKALLPAKRTTGMIAPVDRAAVLERAAA